MAYYIFSITSDKKLTFLDEIVNYREARTATRSLRTDQPADTSDVIKMTFAKSQKEAEKLLTMEREPRPIGEEF
ncbi:MAG TPA: hypothetical protein EYN73_09745 [Chromatiaceae bacterium]|jgi:hypothetical protein|nr:hypothetical protein [Chromatiaceae bacterium]HIN81385.1 hypothetical protein [Chromatiales bacterium]HIO13812.1 hypothetical protein [Chromatiales bacterium]